MTPGQDQAPQLFTRGIAVQRVGPRGWLQIHGVLDRMTRRHLDDLLDWLITGGTTQITVLLETVEEIDHESIVVLQVAHARLRSGAGQLLVIAPRAAARAAAASPGAGEPVREPMFGIRAAGHRLPLFPIFASEPIFASRPAEPSTVDERVSSPI